MRLQSTIKYISKFLEPTRVFIALMLAVTMWLFPFISFKEKTVTPIEHGEIISAVPFTAGAIGECSNVRCDPGYCCQFGYCVIKNKADCGQDDPPPPSPPTISANLNCSNWGDNGWCKGSLSIDLSAADPQGQAVVISGAVNGNNFACPSGATSCSIPLSGEGTGSVNYQVNSATGLSATGSTIYKIDLTSPDLDTSVSGAAGTNGWYRSDVTLGVSASDATSGIASITASINGGGAAAVGGSLTFSDGEYSVLIVARDNTGHVTQDTQIIKVDTITPSLSFTTGGTNGKNGWYVSSASAAATASDAGSGLASIEASVDGGTWVVSNSISLGDGVHTYQFRATDVAGNKTETPTQTALVDTIAPSISMSQGTSLGDKVLYEIEDYGSGLSIFRAVIEDDDEAYQKVTWSGDISGSYIADDILWDGKFADGARAGIGEYMVTLKITDAAGNKAIKTTFVTVGLLDLLDDIPAFAPPISSTSEEDEIPTTASITGPQTFGGIPTTTNAGEFISTTSTVSGITIPTTNIPIDPNILWGAAATAMVGATLADWQKKREEEERRRAAERAEEDRRANTEKRKAQKAAETAVRERWQEDARQERANNASTARWEGLAKLEEAKQQAKINDANAARWAGLAALEQKKEQAAFDHRMDEHTGEQDKVNSWYDQQHRLSEHQSFPSVVTTSIQTDDIAEAASTGQSALAGLRSMMAGIMIKSRPFKGGPEVKPLVNTNALGGWALKIYKGLLGDEGAILNEVGLNKSAVGKSIPSLEEAGTIVAKNGLKVTKATWITAGLVSLATNAYDYSVGEHKDEGFGQEFVVSTTVDILTAVGIGLLAAGLVALLPFSMTATAAAGVIALVGIGLGFAFATPLPLPGFSEPTSITDVTKNLINTGIDNIETWWQK